MVSRKQVVEKAREYIGTPFMHQGRVKGLACDCVGLPLMIGEELGLVDKNGKEIHAQDHNKYGSQPLARIVQDIMESRLAQKSLDDLQEGDLVTVRMPFVPCHVAIISRLYVGTPDECLGMIHAFSQAGKVVEHVLSDMYRRQLEAAFSFPGVD